MKKILAIVLMIGALWACAAVADSVPSCPYPNPAVANSPKACYVMLTVPAGNKVNFPVYVYQQNSNGSQTQYGVYLFSGQQFFLGEYSNTFTATYALYYQSSKDKTWHSCTLSLANGQLSGGSCPGPSFTLDQPAGGFDQGAYNLTMGTGSQWNSVAGPNPAPTPRYYQPRTITFVNNTRYKTIWLGETCSTSNTPECVTNNELFSIPQGGNYVFSVDQNALVSANFYVSAYQNAQGKKIYTGGHGGHNEGTTFATLFEITYHAVKFAGGGNPTPGVTPISYVNESTFDISAVDGFSGFGMQVQPDSPTYCTTTIGSDDSSALGVGYYSSDNPMAYIQATPSMSLQQLCSISSQLPAGNTGPGAWDLSVLSPKDNNAFLGCYSLCTYATFNKLPNAAQYCCTGKYRTAATCTIPPASSYINNLYQYAKHVYGFSYDDFIGTLVCDGMTNVTVTITSDMVENTITFNNVTPVVSDVTTGGASVSWVPATDSDSSATITYSVQLTQNGSPVPNAKITMGANNTATIANLTPTTPYQVVINATDNTGASATSNSATFTTATPTYGISAPTNVAASDVNTDSAVISWTAATDNVPSPQLNYTIAVTPPPAGANYSTANTSEQLINLSSDTQYTVVVSAVDSGAANSPQAAAPIQFTTKAITPPNDNGLSQPVLSILRESPRIVFVTWPNVTFNGQSITDPKANVTYTVSVQPTISSAVGVYYLQNGMQARLRGLKLGDTYTVTITASYNGNTATSLPLIINN
ncbi:MAG: hypothetical protein A3I77_02625 [Gammaproteobacteria bacterium RIFCSPLOWO2_02_FULL_42_14]|nr:MAG: hypothetical protein A3B71_02465 [Gammaproteobacteria bacterium RIFCSPHIGHO2_02_FULL_42_43]OGT53546.1 MAG: hypothetical protein A3E54_02490 [Gammaproteobacteria bacterium RIFCSPHIGHO2_12_FULL_41_25]OGT61490.1 MAG: hypothetical protein A3I77_02625 [Gammaproteobacteria bacterium RIFCSPLOWO2_02_FULL_42_14]OGT86742.1 MAG: hypothetical protein A3G86_05255 [Gammaproteobacteria bacterium RIFCSPLOWO2_12_FULL_42_18]